MRGDRLFLADGAVPLVALDAVAIDTEATGLDTAKDRIVEIAAVRLRGNELKPDAPLRQLVQPGIPIPDNVVRIHGLDQDVLAGAPDFADVWPTVRDYLGRDVLIGHMIGFDLALLRREVEQQRGVWTDPLHLDIGLLARIAHPGLVSYSLDDIATAFKIDIRGRHTALGDATATAKIFAALLPGLRDRGIRTFAEAVRASDELSSRLNLSGGAHATGPSLAERVAASSAIDTYPFRHRVSDVMTSPAKWLEPDATVRTALAIMSQAKISSLFVGADSHSAEPRATGIITERDMLRAVDAHGPGALSLPIGRIMSTPLMTVPADALAYIAIGRMSRHKIRHLGVTGDDGTVTGAVSARDLLRLHGEAAVELTDEIEEAGNVAALARAWGQIVPAAGSLRRDGMSGAEVAALVSQQVGELTRSAARIAEQAMIQAGRGGPPCPYAVMVLGSAGRGESLLATDQDNALIFADGAPPNAEHWFETMAAHLADLLHQAGVPYCSGGVMAKNPQWRGSMASWQDRVGDWITRSRPDDLLAVDIFFDLKAAHGDVALVKTLRREAFAAAKGNTAFAKLLLEAAGQPQLALAWFGRFRTVEGRIDLKKSGLFSLTSIARALAIQHNIMDRSTPQRLRAIKALFPNAAANLDTLIEAHALFLDLILAQQLADAQMGLAVSNRVEVRRLSARERQRLRAALTAIDGLDELARDLMFPEPGAG